jgi:hypothetical protein
LPGSGENYTIQYGFIDSAPTTAVFGSGRGVFFELDQNSPNWFAVFLSNTSGGANYRRVDTGVLAVAATLVTFRVHLRAHATDVASRKADYYINGNPVATILHNDTGVTVIPTSTRLSMALVIKKSSGTTARSTTMTSHYSEIEGPALPAGYA